MKKLLTLLALAFCLDGKAQIISTFAGNGLLSAGYSGDGGQATAAELNAPWGVAIDIHGNLYIADYLNNRVRKVNTAGIITTVAGNGTVAYTGDGGQATAATLNTVFGVTCDAIGNLYIADSQNNVIRKVNMAGIITTFAGNGTAAYIGDGGQATSASLNNPNGVACDAAGNLYIADRDNECIRKVTTGGTITTVAGGGFSGLGDGGQATMAQLSQPTGVTLDLHGNLYIADNFNNRIRKVTTAGIISTVAGNGTNGYSGDGAQATAAELGFPNGVACDGAGNIYIADSQNNVVRKVSTSGIITTIAGDQSLGFFSGDGGQATAAGMSDPEGIFFDGSGNLYIANSGENTVRKVTHVGVAGLEEFKSNNSIEVTTYPNPAKDVLHVACEIANEKATLTLTDMLGNIVKQMPFTTQHLTLNLTDLNEGVYNISISSSEGIINKRIVLVK